MAWGYSDPIEEHSGSSGGNVQRTRKASHAPAAPAEQATSGGSWSFSSMFSGWGGGQSVTAQSRHVYMPNGALKPTFGHPQAVDFDTSTRDGRLMANIARIESGGHVYGRLAYDAVGAVTKGNHNALGFSGVMDYNLPKWGANAGYSGLTREKYLASKDIQLNVTRTQIKAEIAAGYSDRQIARHWLGNGTDVNGMTTNQYANLVTGELDETVAGHEGSRHHHGAKRHLRHSGRGYHKEMNTEHARFHHEHSGYGGHGGHGHSGPSPNGYKHKGPQEGGHGAHRQHRAYISGPVV